jgi:hypothetical protein
MIKGTLLSALFIYSSVSFEEIDIGLRAISAQAKRGGL